MSHTPGPWRLEEFFKDIAIQAGPTKLGDLLEVAQLPLQHSNFSPEQVGANARLIAAAPDLLEACIAVVKAGMIGRDVALAQDKARKAIVKATGGQS